MSQQIELSCPGGKCPIKNLCNTWGKQNATMMPHPPFNQQGMVVRCSYFDLKRKHDEPRKLFANTETIEVVEKEKEKAEVPAPVFVEEKRTVEKVAVSQKSLFD